ncbi:MAG: hypothetical protein FWD58_00910 [Firmicutes bacterium]|nr:hypothetical protein [Bacillota bacterium]
MKKTNTTKKTKLEYVVFVSELFTIAAGAAIMLFIAVQAWFVGYLGVYNAWCFFLFLGMFVTEMIAVFGVLPVYAGRIAEGDNKGAYIAVALEMAAIFVAGATLVVLIAYFWPFWMSA